ncbi:MAG: hypothetical protein ACOYXT_02435 [Bacteroidota bacterium]
MTQQFIITEELNPLEHILKAVLNAITRSYGFINKAAGLLGVVLIMPLFAAVTFVMWVVLKFTNWRLEKGSL